MDESKLLYYTNENKPKLGKLHDSDTKDRSELPISWYQTDFGNFWNYLAIWP